MPIANSAARLSQFRLFEGLSPDELGRVGTLVDERPAVKGDVLHREGEMPTHLFLLESGQVLAEGHDQGRVIIRRVVEPGDIVGRRAVAAEVRHMATATVQQDSRLLTISLGNLRILRNMFPLLNERLARTDVHNRLMAMPLFSDFGLAELWMLVDLLRIVDYGPGQTIFRRGDLADAMYVIDTGQVIETVNGVVQVTGNWPKFLAAGNFFGRRGLRTGSARRATATAATPVRLFRLNGPGLDWLIQYKPGFEKALERPDMVRLLGGTHLFQQLSETEIKQLAGYTGLAHYRPGTVIMRQGETDRSLHILYDGQALARSYDAQGREKSIESLVPGAVLGEGSLFLNEPHSATVEAPVASDWLYLSRDDLDRYLAAMPGVQDKLQPRAVVQERQHYRRYSWMDPDERILFRQRRHWFALFERLTAPLLVVLLGLFLLFVPSRGSHEVLTYLSLPVLAIGLPWLVWRLLDWLNDFYIVTSKRVVRIERVIAVRESRQEVPLDKVQNINLARSAIGNWIGFGALTVETAASFGGARIRFTYLQNPQYVQELIFEEMSHVRAGRRTETQRAIRDTLAARLGTAHEPLVPRVATMPFTAPEPDSGTPSPLVWLTHVVDLNPLWMERREAERITWRKHWIRLLARVWAPLLVGIVVVLSLIVFLIGGGQLTPLLLVLAAVVILPTMAWGWWGLANWGNDQYTVTNDRLIDIEKLPLGLRTQQTETMFDKVQNVSFEVPDPVATLLNYGTVIIHTAGAEGRLTFNYVSRPSQVQAEIFRRLSAFNETRRRREREERWADLPEWFAYYAELTRRGGP